MRILVLSDIHGDLRSAMQAVNAQPSADMLVFCGDGAEQFKYLKNVLPDKTVVGVRGNCDFGSDLQPTEIVTAGGKTLFITHGHLYQAKFSIYNMVCAAREANADVLLFGHTHNAFQEYDLHEIHGLCYQTQDGGGEKAPRHNKKTGFRNCGNGRLLRRKGFLEALQ